jgi:hypothetical protein
MARHTLVFFGVQVALRVAIAMASNGRVRAQQKPVAFAVTRAAQVLFYADSAYLLEQVVCYIGGPARDALASARAGSMRGSAQRPAARTSGAASLSASSQERQASGFKLTGRGSSNRAKVAPDVDAASPSAASVRHGDSSIFSSKLPVESSDSSAAPTS